MEVFDMLDDQKTQKDIVRKNFTTTYDLDIIKRARIYAASNDLRLNEVIEQALIEYLDRNGGDANE
jgi:hypothetical protein